MFGDLFKKDLEKYYKIHHRTKSPPFRARLRLWICSHGLHCVASYRFGQFADGYRKKHPLSAIPLIVIHRAISYWVATFYHVHIDATTIGPGFYIGHIGTIYIGPTEIGDNFSLTHNVTIGVGHANRREGVPRRIGNNVWIGTGATVYGSIEIGNDVTIASGCILSRDTPDGSLMGGNPGKMILRQYDNSNLFGSDEAPPPLTEAISSYVPPAKELRGSTAAPPLP